MGATLPISNLISIGLNLAAQPLPVQNFQSMLVLGPSAVIDVTQRFRTYYNLTAVGADFGSTTPEYLAAQAWFGQNPAPKSLYIGRWVQTASAGQLIGGAVSAANQVLAIWTAITTGSFTVSINGAAKNITGLDFHLQTTMTGVASVIQTALNAAVSGTTCVWNSVYNNFIIQSPTTDTGSTISFASTYSSGVDISALMGGTAAAGAYVANGLAAETALASVQYFDLNYPTMWFGLYVAGALAADYQAIAGYIEGVAGRHFQGVPTQDPNCLNASDTTNIAYKLQQLLYSWSAVQYSSTSLYAVVSLLARILTTDWTGSNTAIDLMYKQEPGIAPEALTATTAAALKNFNCNVYASYNIGATLAGTPIIQYGICPSGNYIDTVIGAAALAGTIQTNMFNALFTTTTKIPQTNSGQGALEGQIVLACQQFVNNGWLGPNVWDGPTFGNIQKGQFLPKGWYIYQPSVASQSPSQRASRAAVPFQIAAVLAGAVNTASVQINVAT